MITVDVCAPDDPEAAAVLDRLSEALAAITGDSGRGSFDPADVGVDRAVFVVARDGDGAPVGCGAYRPLGPGVAELKRMYAAPGTKGVGAAVLQALTSRAMADGYGQLWLATRRVNVRAVRFYEKHGYAPIAPYGRYVGRPETVCLAKAIAPAGED
ncbi:GNAT family N-acetyltransferase [Caulobacter sp. 17J65-9]|uniref:GNAT family N-acetyltransferase n=1 Tax=Caulobacter sp. 17J65-9 TaxID=2709382 RepID=UPI0013CD5ADD|nr:GNAT family N-acetyltransferase [Caulobacter sp. 17J65-9]NEX93707.1 GNAT family N-acetyltransferase [Caulobacter sp. 17J65-9]